MSADKITSPSTSKRMIPSRYGQLQVGALKIAYQDATCSLWLDAYKVPLSPTEYRLCAALLQGVGREPLEPARLPDGNRVLAWVPRQTLLQLVGGRYRHRALSRQISNLNSKLFTSGLHLVAFEQNYGLVLLPSAASGEEEVTSASSHQFHIHCYESAQAPGMLGDMDTEAFTQYATRLLSWMTEDATRKAGTASTPQLPFPAFQTTQAVHPPLHPEPMSFILTDVTRHLLPSLTQTTAPGYLGQEASTISGPALLGAMLSSTLSLVSRAGIGFQAQNEVEQLVLCWLHQLLRLPLPRQGGSLHQQPSAATLLAIQTARLASTVSPTTPVRLYASEHAHPHVLAVARFLGLSESGGIRLLPVDGRGHLHARIMQAAVQEDRLAGWHPLLVIATVGTPTLGSCDPVAELAEICAREQLWLHVDATLYGGAAINPIQTALLDGVEQASSLLIGLAPWLPITSGTTALWLREKHATQFTQTDLRDASAALPVWMVLRYFGQVGLVRRLREYLRLAHLFATWIDATAGWERLTPTVLHTVCFRAHPDGYDDLTALAALNRHLAEQLSAAGRFVVELVAIRQVVALRLTIGNLRLLEEDVHLLCSYLEAALHKFLAQTDCST